VNATDQEARERQLELARNRYPDSFIAGATVVHQSAEE